MNGIVRNPMRYTVNYDEYDNGMGAGLLSFLNPVKEWVLGKGNRPGTPESRAGIAPAADTSSTIDPNLVAQIVQNNIATAAAQQQAAVAAPVDIGAWVKANPQMAAAVGGGFVLLLLMGRKR